MTSLDIVSKVQIFGTAFKTLPLIIFALIGIWRIPQAVAQVDYIKFIDASFWREVNVVASMVLWAFIGIESAVIPADQLKDPHRTIKYGTVIGVVLAAVIYIFGTLAILTSFSAEELRNVSTPYVHATKYFIGENMGFLVAIIGILGIVFTLNGWVLIQGQVLYRVAKDFFLPKFISVTNKHHVPSTALVISSILVSIILMCLYTMPIADQFIWLAFFSSFTIVVPYLYSSLAAIIVAKKTKNLTAKNITIYGLGLVYSIFAIIGMPYDVIAVGTILMFCFSAPIYTFLNQEESKFNNSQAQKEISQDKKK